MPFIVCQAAEPVHSFEPESFEQIVKANKGKPFVILVWSLDCNYCLPSFQALAKAKQKHGLKVVTIATDRADDAEAAHLIRKKLEAGKLAEDSWAFGSAPPEQLRYTIDPKWRGELPRSYWFDARGNVIAHSGLIKPETVAKLAAK
jgi:thiol-disulfide isomerase/thioredoxin